MARPIVGQYSLRGGLTRIADKLPVYNLDSVGDVVQFAHLVGGKDTLPTYDTVIVDDIDLMMADAISLRMADAIREGGNLFSPYTQVYGIAGGALHKIMLLKAQGKNVIITCGEHRSKGVVMNSKGKEVPVSCYRPDFPQAFWRELGRLVDLVGYCAVFGDGTVKMLTQSHVSDTRKIEAKCTLGLGFPRTMVLGLTVQTNEFVQLVK
jgi:hypothetical protein